MSCCPEDTDSVDDHKSYIRECTDVFWLCLFLGFWISMILVASFAFVYGNPIRLTNGYDSFGNVCDSDDNYKFGDFNFSGAEMSEKKYLFFMDFVNVQDSLQICVKQCPDKDMLNFNDIEDFYNRTGSSLCRYDFDFKFLREANFSINSSFGPCPTLPVYKSTPILNRCVPEIATDVGIYFSNESWNFVEELVGDLYRAWRWILYLTLISVVLSMIVVSLFHLFANVVSWMIVVLVGAVGVVVTAVLWWNYFDIKCQLDNRESGQWLNEEVNNEEVFRIYAIIATIVTLIILLFIFVMRKRISFLAALFQEASNCLADLPCLYLQPFISFLLLVIFYAFWISVVVCLATASYVESKRFVPHSASTSVPTMKNETNGSSFNRNVTLNDLTSFTAVQYIESTWLKYMLLLYFVGLIWVSEFILACQHMVVAGTVAKWYFNSKNDKNSGSMVMTSIGNLVFYHLGSAALGSFLITLFKLPRIVLTYLQKKFRKNKDEFLFAEYGLKCCSCCFYALEKFIRFMNHNAYTVVAIQGINFCPAAYRAWKVLANNTLRLTVVNTVGDFILFLGKCFVAMIMTIIAVLIFKFDASLKFYAGPTLIVFIFSYFVSHVVISLYELVIDTLFLCICEDQEMNGNEGQWKTTLLASIEYKGVKRCPPPPPTEL